VAAEDAASVADVLKDPEVGAYPCDQIELIRDEQVTRDGLIAALVRLAKRTSDQDTAFIFYCGHGVLGEDGLYYFTTQDTVLVAGSRVRSGTGVNGAELLGLVRAIKARKLLLVVNACFSGRVNPVLAPTEEALGIPLSQTLRHEFLATGEGRAIITASRQDQYSYYQVGKKSTYFGQALVDGLRGQGAAGHGDYVGLYDLYQHVYTTVTAQTSGAQDPVLTILEGVGPFPVSLRPVYARTGPSSTPALSAAPTGAATEVIREAELNDTGRVRALMTELLTDEEVDALAMDHFRPVYDQFSRGMSRTAKIHRLIEHCSRRRKLGVLLTSVRAYEAE